MFRTTGENGPTSSRRLLGSERAWRLSGRRNAPTALGFSISAALAIEGRFTAVRIVGIEGAAALMHVPTPGTKPVMRGGWITEIGSARTWRDDER